MLETLNHYESPVGEQFLQETIRSPPGRQNSIRNCPLTINRQLSGLSPAIMDSEIDKTTQEDLQTGISTSVVETGGLTSDRNNRKDGRQPKKTDTLKRSIDQSEEKNVDMPFESLLKVEKNDQPQEPQPLSYTANRHQETHIRDGHPGERIGEEGKVVSEASIGIEVADQPFDERIVVPVAFRRDQNTDSLIVAGPGLNRIDSDKVGIPYKPLVQEDDPTLTKDSEEEVENEEEDKETNQKIAKKNKFGRKKTKKTTSKVASSKKVKNSAGKLSSQVEDQGQPNMGMNLEPIGNGLPRTVHTDRVHQDQSENLEVSLQVASHKESATKIEASHQKTLAPETHSGLRTPSPPQTASRMYETRATHSSKQPSYLTAAKDPKTYDKKLGLLGKRKPQIEQTPPPAKVNSAFKVLAGPLGQGKKVLLPKRALETSPITMVDKSQTQADLEKANLRRTRAKDEPTIQKSNLYLTRTTRNKDILPALFQKKLQPQPKPPKDLSDSNISQYNKGSKKLKKEEIFSQKQNILKDKIAPSAKKSTKDKSGSPAGEQMSQQTEKLEQKAFHQENRLATQMDNELEDESKTGKAGDNNKIHLYKKDRNSKTNNFENKAVANRKKAEAKLEASYQLNTSYLPRNMCHGPASLSSKTESISDNELDEFREIQDFLDFKRLRQKIKKEVSQKNKKSRHSLNLSRIEVKTQERSPQDDSSANQHTASIQKMQKSDSKTLLSQQILTRNQKPAANCWSIYEDTIRFTVLNDRQAFLKLVALTPPYTIRKAADFGSEQLDINRIFGREEFEELLMALSVKISSNSILKIGGFVYSEPGETILADLIKDSPGGSGRVFWSTIKESMEIYMVRPKDISPKMKPYFDGADTEECRTAKFCFLLLQDAELYQDCRRMRPVAFEKDEIEDHEAAIKATFLQEREGKYQREATNDQNSQKTGLYSTAWKPRESNDLLNFDNQGRKASLNELDEYQLDSILEKRQPQNRYIATDKAKQNSSYYRGLSNSLDKGDKQSCCSSLVDFKH